jgi:thiamine pyrophosphokinase
LKSLLNRTVVLANGTFPKKNTLPERILQSAKRVVCCDGAADSYVRKTGKFPDAVVGDCDSLKGEYPNTVTIPEQETNDLEKAVKYCRSRDWNDIIVLGATGLREDHAIGNVFRALDLDVEIITQSGRFIPVSDTIVLNVKKGCAISIFAPDKTTVMTSEGLQWSLNEVKFDKIYTATLNRASKSRVRFTTTKKVSVFVCE